MKGLLRYIPAVIGLLFLAYLFHTGDYHSETAYPLLQLNLYLTALVIVLPWLEDERFGFEVKVFAPLWLPIAAVLAGMEFLGGLAAILWLTWLFLPLFRIDSVLIFLRKLTENLNLRKNPVRALIIVLAHPLLIVVWYHAIFGVQAVVLMAIYVIYVIPIEFRKSRDTKDKE
ncbi:hypothetical protein GQS_06670 [Thermococcus sp. 4557]|uniref:hypothetical protein n=1 Tax=Thermococcus sp. (strain CGMCC 1.5172 / 4557) TaxID=1042877 RepID=UPI000219E911|nr:hypothetical protein [Thermococcus sp. 4557]AEK73232.1 hypothetical protein GQS_06670 [Thermococcus sp. 4557]